MANTKTMPNLERVQVMLRRDLYQQVEAYRQSEDRSLSKMASMLIEEALAARAETDQKITRASA